MNNWTFYVFAVGLTAAVVNACQGPNRSHMTSVSASIELLDAVNALSKENVFIATHTIQTSGRCDDFGETAAKLAELTFEEVTKFAQQEPDSLEISPLHALHYVFEKCKKNAPEGSSCHVLPRVTVSTKQLQSNQRYEECTGIAYASY